MMPYEKFKAWQLAHQLALEVFRVTDDWPKEGRFGLTIQLWRAALSAPTNIAEGSAKRGNANSGASWTSLWGHCPKSLLYCDSVVIEDCCLRIVGRSSNRCAIAPVSVDLATLPFLLGGLEDRHDA
jgi:23S rRNA-intervening sequence protein